MRCFLGAHGCVFGVLFRVCAHGLCVPRRQMLVENFRALENGMRSSERYALFDVCFAVLKHMVLSMSYS